MGVGGCLARPEVYNLYNITSIRFEIYKIYMPNYILRYLHIVDYW